MNRRQVVEHLGPRWPYKERANFDFCFLTQGPVHVIWYGHAGEVALDKSGAIQQLCGHSLFADGTVVLAVGEFERTARQRLGPPDHYVAETSQTTSGYWPRYRLEILFRAPSYGYAAENTILSIYLEGINNHEIEDRFPR